MNGLLSDAGLLEVLVRGVVAMLALPVLVMLLGLSLELFRGDE